MEFPKKRKRHFPHSGTVSCVAGTVKNLVNNMNLITVKEEKLETLPRKQKFLEGRGERKYGNDFPYNRTYRFLASRIGQSLAQVLSDFVHADWIPPRFRNLAKFRDFVELNTFIKDKEIYFNDSRGYRGTTEVALKDSSQDVYYIHPKTKLLCFQKEKRTNYAKIQREKEAKVRRVIGKNHELQKVNGIWHEYKYELVKSDVIEIDGLHYQKVPVTISEFDLKCKGLKNLDKYKIQDGCYLVPFATSPWYRSSSQPKHKTIINRQLSKNQLKKYGLRNDNLIGLSHNKCPKCGGYDCSQHHGKFDSMLDNR